MSQGKNPYDAIVVGAGIVGCAVACELAERGMRTALVERGDAGRGTSGNTFAWINATSKTADAAYHRLNADGAERYRRLAAEWGERRLGLHPTGMLEWAGAAHADTLAELRSRAEALAALGYPVAWVKEDDLAAMEPHVRFEEGAEGLHAMADAWLDVPTFLRFLLARLRGAGGAVLEHCTATTLLLGDQGTVRGIDTTSGRLHAPEIVVAAGPATGEALAALTAHEAFATRFPVRRAPGLLVSTPPGDARRLARRVLYAAGAGLHFRETRGGGLLLGADDTDGLVSEDSSSERLQEAATVLLDRTRRRVPAFAGPALLAHCRLGIGVRPVPADGKSIAGPVPGAEGLHVAVTHSGVTLAPVLGALMADTITSGRVAPQLAPFSLERFQGFR